MTSFAACASPLQDAAINQNGGNFLIFKPVWKKICPKLKKKTFWQKCFICLIDSLIQKYEKGFDELFK